MCGIIAVSGQQDCLPCLRQGLRDLTYRGYDSCGIAVVDASGILRERSVGNVETLPADPFLPRTYCTGIAHTRWATHGEPSVANAHPHMDAAGTLALVHNGIIENYRDLRANLEADGVTFASATDTEVIVALLARCFRSTNDPIRALIECTRDLEGSFAFVAIRSSNPSELLFARQDCPLVIGQSHDATYVASDVIALRRHCSSVCIADQACLGLATSTSMRLYEPSGRSLTLPYVHIPLSIASTSKESYPHFMIKEICEQPAVAASCMQSRSVDTLFGPEATKQLKDINRVVFLGCGTPLYAADLGRICLESLCAVPATSLCSSEFRYREPVAMHGVLVVAVSQSGETADTIAASRQARKQGAIVLGLTKVDSSTLARESDICLELRAGPEVAVASTKAFLSEAIVASLAAATIARLHDGRSHTAVDRLVGSLHELPSVISSVLQRATLIKSFAERLVSAPSVYFIGRQYDEPVAREGALKLKEVAYVHAESLPAGELKHGHIALITDGFPVVALATQHGVAKKMVSNLEELRARHAEIYIITTVDLEPSFRHLSSHIVTLTNMSPLANAIAAAVPLQLLGYYAGLSRGSNVDCPRNLAKSVTVE